MRKPKAPPLTKATRVRIGKKKEKHPHLTYRELAEQFGVSYDQARDACRKYDAGELGGRRKPRQAKVEPGTELRDLFQRAVDHANAETLNAMELVSAVERLARSRHTIQQLELTGHMRATDAAIIAGIIRRYEPSADDDRVIQIYREECEKWKASA